MIMHMFIVCIYIYAYSYIYIYIYAYTYTCIYTYIHKHTHTHMIDLFEKIVHTTCMSERKKKNRAHYDQDSALQSEQSRKHTVT
jgi:hypothetical protein